MSAKDKLSKEDMKQSSLKREFLIGKNNGDGRKKIFDTESVMSQSTSNSESNFKSLDRSEEIEWEKRILGIGMCSSD